MAPDQGIEPRFLDPESSVLPLDQSGMGEAGNRTRIILADYFESRIRRGAHIHKYFSFKLPLSAR